MLAAQACRSCLAWPPCCNLRTPLLACQFAGFSLPPKPCKHPFPSLQCALPTSWWTTTSCLTCWRSRRCCMRWVLGTQGVEAAVAGRRHIVASTRLFIGTSRHVENDDIAPTLILLLLCCCVAGVDCDCGVPQEAGIAGAPHAGPAGEAAGPALRPHIHGHLRPCSGGGD